MSNQSHENRSEDEDLTGMYEVLDAIKAVVAGADQAKRDELAKTLDAFANDFPDEYFWATGPQAPALLHHLMMTIDVECRSQPKARRLIERKPAGTA
jgi:hypothetical protein